MMPMTGLSQVMGVQSLLAKLSSLFFIPQVLTFHSSFMRREDAGISAGGGADVQVKLDIFLQSETLSVVTPGKNGLVVLLFMVTEDKKSVKKTPKKLYNIECERRCIFRTQMQKKNTN